MSGSCASNFVKFLHFFVKFVLLLAFLSWSVQALYKFWQHPITSAVSFNYGDNGRGQVQFPSISICLRSFEMVSQSKALLYNCSVSQIKTFVAALEFCTAAAAAINLKKDSTAETTTSDSTMFGGLFQVNLDNL